jgi:uncharacterized protein (DUF433 family)
MKRYRPDPDNPPRLTDEEARRLDEAEIDHSDIPELGDEFFAKAKREETMWNNPEALTEIALRAFARAKDEAIRENDRLGVPSYGSEDGQIVVRQPPQAIDWHNCPDVESVPGRCSGAWVVKDSRVLVHGIINNAAAGCGAAEIADMFAVPSDTVRRIVAFAEAQTPSAMQELYDTILDLVSQNCTCGKDDDAFDSWAISAYERAIIALERAGYVEIDNGPGRIFGRLTEHGRMFDAWMALHDRRSRIADARQHLATVPGAMSRREAVARLYGVSVADLDPP